VATGKVRPRRSKAPVVAVTGAASGAGRLLAARLAEREEIRKVVAIDGQRGDVPGVTWRVTDIRDPLLSGRLSDVDVVVNLDIDRSPMLPLPARTTPTVPSDRGVTASVQRCPTSML
jgi:nucleoside-diphosphate-sugar epimerase